MIAFPILLVLGGYWVLYAGIKRQSLGAAWNCAAQSQATAGDQSGSITVQPVTGGPTLGVTTDCRPQPGDTKLPAGFIWRPLCPWKGAPAAVCQANGRLVGPC